jgi:pimeloyl-ACP methyl ester carboxylesterase
MKTQLSINKSSLFVWENKSEGKPILFIHGNSLSSNSFKLQLEAPELQKYRLVAFDWPGHGKSSKPENAEEIYAFKNLVQLIPKIINELNLEKPIIVAHSFGGHIAIEAIPFLENIAGLVVFGTPPLKSPMNMEEAFLPNTHAPLMFTPELDTDKIDMLCTQFSENQSNYKSITHDISLTDPMFRGFVGQQLMQGKTQNEMELLSMLDSPLAVFHGKKDPLVNQSYLSTIPKKSLWRNKIHVINNAGHTAQLDNHKLFNKLLIQYAEDIFS